MDSILKTIWTTVKLQTNFVKKLLYKFWNLFIIDRVLKTDFVCELYHVNDNRIQFIYKVGSIRKYLLESLKHWFYSALWALP